MLGRRGRHRGRRGSRRRSVWSGRCGNALLALTMIAPACRCVRYVGCRRRTAVGTWQCLGYIIQPRLFVELKHI